MDSGPFGVVLGLGGGFRVFRAWAVLRSRPSFGGERGGERVWGLGCWVEVLGGFRAFGA